jgi:ribosomal protein S18 acetylase RimI-like enzyme
MITVHSAVPADGQAVLRVINSIDSFSPEESDCVNELWEDFAQNGKLSAYQFCVSKDDTHNKINGFACYGKHALTRSTYDLYWIAVDPYQQRSGVGSNLLFFVEEQVSSQAGSQLLIETSSTQDYKAARMFYRQHHYKKASILRDFYAPGDHLIIFSKNLKSPQKKLSLMI